jgi:hypothetical protein
MLFHSFGGNDEVRYGGAARPRSCAQIAIRLELLEDRFLLTGASGSESPLVAIMPLILSPGWISNVSLVPGAASTPVQAGSASTGMASASSAGLPPGQTGSASTGMASASSAGLPPGQAGSASTGVASAGSVESPPVQARNASTATVSAGSVDKSTQNESAVVPASQQQAPAAADSSDTQQNGSTSGSSTAPNSISQVESGSSVVNGANSGSGEFCTNGSGNVTISAGVASGTSSQTSTGVGSGTSSQSSSMNFAPAGSNSIPSSSSTQSASISPPLPNPAGIPAGGIFRQVAANSLNAAVSVLEIDPVASDLSDSGPAAVGFPGSALSVYIGQPASLAAQPAPNIIGFRIPRPSLLSSSDSRPVVVSVKTAAVAGRERAELPDITELALIDRPVSTVSNAPESPDPKATDASLAALTTTTQEVALPAPPILPGTIDPAESDTDDGHRARQRMSTNLVIYSATSLSMAASAPGLASMIRRDKRRDDRRQAVAGGDHASGPRR